MPAPENQNVIVQFRNESLAEALPQLSIPVGASVEQLTMLLNHVLKNEDPMKFSFLVDDNEVEESLAVTIKSLNKSTEASIDIWYQPQAVFRVRSVTRCSSTLSGHTEAILCVLFSPDGKMLATGSGDTTVRVWDLNTETPRFTLKGHRNWVQHVAFSPDSQLLISGGMDKTVSLSLNHLDFRLESPQRYRIRTHERSYPMCHQSIMGTISPKH